MIDDTGPRITALERRVAALEREAVRFADLRAVLRHMLFNHKDASLMLNAGIQWVEARNRIEQARAARSDIRSAGAPVTVYPGEGIEVTVRGGGGAAREDQTTGGGGKLHPRDSSSRNHAEASEVLGSNPSPPTTYAAQRLIAAALAAADTWTDANQSYRVPLMDAAKAYRAAREDPGVGVESVPTGGAQPGGLRTAPMSGRTEAATPTHSPTLAEAMEAMRRHVRLGESKYKSDSDTIAWGGKLDDMARAVLAAWDEYRKNNPC